MERPPGPPGFPGAPGRFIGSPARLLGDRSRDLVGHDAMHLEVRVVIAAEPVAHAHLDELHHVWRFDLFKHGAQRQSHRPGQIGN